MYGSSETQYNKSIHQLPKMRRNFKKPSWLLLHTKVFCDRSPHLPQELSVILSVLNILVLLIPNPYFPWWNIHPLFLIFHEVNFPAKALSLCSCLEIPEDYDIKYFIFFFHFSEKYAKHCIPFSCLQYSAASPWLDKRNSWKKKEEKKNHRKFDVGPIFQSNCCLADQDWKTSINVF